MKSFSISLPINTQIACLSLSVISVIVIVIVIMTRSDNDSGNDNDENHNDNDIDGNDNSNDNKHSNDINTDIPVLSFISKGLRYSIAIDLPELPQLRVRSIDDKMRVIAHSVDDEEGNSNA